MRKVLGLMLACMVTAPAVSAGVHNMAGCGLGAMVFAGNEKGPQVVAVTLNATGSQTFGITAGTLGCTKDGKVVKNKKRIVFAEANFPSLKREMAVGNGEYLDAFAALFDYDDKEFGSWVRKNYTKLIPSTKTTASEMVRLIEAEIPVRS